MSLLKNRLTGKLLAVTAMIAASVLSAHAQMYKCSSPAGKIEYRQSPCEDSRQTRGLSGGTTSGIAAMPSHEVQRALNSSGPEPGPNVTVIGGDRRGVPTERDIKNLETSASSRTLGQKEKRFMEDEVRRAKLARENGTAYTEKEKRELEYLRSSQTRIDQADRDRARQQAEDIHMRAGQALRDDVMSTRQAEKARVAARRQAADDAAARQAAQSAQGAAALGPTYDRITQCNLGNCQSRSGETYRPIPGAPNTFESFGGKRCTRGASGELTCY
jgi:hypothetical protein